MASTLIVGVATLAGFSGLFAVVAWLRARALASELRRREKEIVELCELLRRTRAKLVQVERRARRFKREVQEGRSVRETPSVLVLESCEGTDMAINQASVSLQAIEHSAERQD